MISIFRLARTSDFITSSSLHRQKQILFATTACQRRSGLWDNMDNGCRCLIMTMYLGWRGRRPGVPSKMQCSCGTGVRPSTHVAGVMWSWTIITFCRGLQYENEPKVDTFDDRAYAKNVEIEIPVNSSKLSGTLPCSTGARIDLPQNPKLIMIQLLEGDFYTHIAILFVEIHWKTLD